MNAELVDALDALLPQTQCTKCGYQGCRPYAEAVVKGDADIDQCPPGGTSGIRKLARLLGRPEKPLNPAFGLPTPRAAALIDESRCIGCLLCLRACPVDAIVGAAKHMHTVLTESCTGCELCLSPCPVDCIDMVDLDTLAKRGNRHAARLALESDEFLAATARKRFELHRFRVARENQEHGRRPARNTPTQREHAASPPGSQDSDRKKATIRAAIERARARRSGRT